MRNLNLTMMIFFQVLLASFILYSTVITTSSASPVAAQHKPNPGAVVGQPAIQDAGVAAAREVKYQAPASVAADSPQFQPAKNQVADKIAPPPPAVGAVKAAPSPVIEPVVLVAKIESVDKMQFEASPASSAQIKAKSVDVPSSVVKQEQRQQQVIEKKSISPPIEQGVANREESTAVVIKYDSAPAPVDASPSAKYSSSLPKAPSESEKSVYYEIEKKSADSAKLPQAPVTVQEARPAGDKVSGTQRSPPSEVSPVADKQPVSQKVAQAPAAGQVAGSAPAQPVGADAPVVKGGLGPLHLLAATLCSSQPDKPVADETLNSLYGQRAVLRKSLFDFMRLRFTNLEKLSSKLNAGLEIMPRKTTDPSQSSVVPTHGWPVVGKCTAHDLKLMAEAAWCECTEEPCDASRANALSSVPPPPTTTASSADEEYPPRITSNQHARANAARAIADQPPAPISSSSPSSADQSSVISKILHVTDNRDAPVVESSIANQLNLTQQQLATIMQSQSQGSSTRECRRKALRLTKSLFNHLAEDQKAVSESWPKLYSQITEDECARKRMIDIVTALASFRTESTSIRRDNVEFAFAMDDLRSKVLENEVNVPLTFDKQFIEVGQFLQQSVKLMLANIDPERAKLASMRYRSLMPGPLSADDQCIELHQRLLAKNYPTDCNPNQFGQLTDVLRMAANSLELWSIESEVSKYSTSKEYQAAAYSAPQTKQEVNECIANLVTS